MSLEQALGNFVTGGMYYNPVTDTVNSNPLAALVGMFTPDEYEGGDKVLERGRLKESYELAGPDARPYISQYYNKLTPEERANIDPKAIAGGAQDLYNVAFDAGKNPAGMTYQAAKANKENTGRLIGLQEKGVDNQLTNSREEREAQAQLAKWGLTGQIDLAKIAERTAAAQTAANNDLLLKQAEMMNKYADNRYQQDRRDALLMMGLQALSGFFA
jgi:hypothetical protein